ncbi:MAG: clostripain-related cysteine peptidase [Candidatus Helarchaeota archaeon]
MIKNRNKIFAIVVSVVILIALGSTLLFLKFKPDKSVSGNHPYKWTIMYYICGDDSNSIKEPVFYSHKNAVLNELGSLDVGVTCLYDGYGNNGLNSSTFRYAIYSNNYSETNIGEKNMGDQTTLEEFLNFSQNIFPAENYALIINGHGSGILHEINTSEIEIGGCCFDHSQTPQYHDYLNSSEIKDSVQGKNINLLIFHSCVMGGVEFLYDLRDCVDLIIASEETTYLNNNDGTFSDFIHEVKQYPLISVEDLGKKFANEYKASHPAYFLKGVMSIINTKSFSLIHDGINEFCNYIKDNNLFYSVEFSRAKAYQMGTQYNYSVHRNIDLLTFLEDTAEFAQDSDLDEIVSNLNGLIKKSIVYNTYWSIFDTYYKGLSIYFPEYENETSLSVYKSASWNLNSSYSWNEFLSDYYSLVSILMKNRLQNLK